MKTKSEYQYILRWNKKIQAINLLGGRCKECGEYRPWILSFHHKNLYEKEFEIARIINYKWSIIEKEIEKCELLCERCHRLKHQKNGKKNFKFSESKKIFLKFKCVSGCEICDYNDYIGALDFHHEKEKKFLISGLSLSKNTSETIIQKIEMEINKCQVLCANCHQDLHFDKEKFEKYKEEIYNWKYKETKECLDKQLVLDLYNQGMKQVDIAKKFGRNKSVICSIIKRNFNG